jgi:hypothetical protein
VALGDITREAVLKGIEEYDALGQPAFLHRYGFDRARQYVLVHDGKRYDSKAIVGVAHGFLPGKTRWLPTSSAAPTAAQSRIAGSRISSRAAAWSIRCTPDQGITGGTDRGRDNSRAERTSALLIRSQDARLAVLLRSEGHCENPRCTGEIQDRTDKGRAILEVDHIHDLALGGPDDPSQMIALCPNCHVIKTRGSTRHGLKKVFLEEARRRHDELSEP